MTGPVISILPKQEAMGVLMASSEHLFLYAHILGEASGMCFQQRPLVTCYVWVVRGTVAGRQARQTTAELKQRNTFAYAKTYAT